MNEQEKNYETIISQFAEMCKGCKTYKSVHNKISKFLVGRYGNSPKIKAFADDFTESVALKLGLSQDF